MVQTSKSRPFTSRKLFKLSLNDEIAHLRGLDATGLQSRWRSMMGSPAPKHLPKHLLFGMLAYRVQADALGDIDVSTADRRRDPTPINNKAPTRLSTTRRRDTFGSPLRLPSTLF
jgi:hypothetical protein